MLSIVFEAAGGEDSNVWLMACLGALFITAATGLRRLSVVPRRKKS